MPKQQFTPKNINTIYGCLAQGNYLKTAAQVAGVSYRSVLGWLQKGREEHSPQYVDFYTEVKRIEATWEAETVKELSHNGSEKVKLEMLSRKNPEQWAATSRTINIVNEKLEQFMDYMVSELSEDKTMLQKFLEIAKNFDVTE